jgi:hypothetical protein
VGLGLGLLNVPPLPLGLHGRQYYCNLGKLAAEYLLVVVGGRRGAVWLDLDFLEKKPMVGFKGDIEVDLDSIG